MESMIAKRWPGRGAEVTQLLAIAEASAHYVPDFFVYGAPSTGKTSVVKDCLAATGRRLAYVQCSETLKPKHLISSIYTQLQGYKRKKAEGYTSVSVDTMSDFFKLLPDICKPSDRTSLIILDDVHWLSRSPDLRALLQARALGGGASVAFVLVSQMGWGCCEFVDLPCMPAIHFPNYKKEQMVDCLVKMWPDIAVDRQEVYRAFCELVVGMFNDTTRDLLDLATLAAHLWPCYSEPLDSLKVSTSGISVEKLRCRLYSKSFLEQMQAARRVYEPGMRVLPQLPGMPERLPAIRLWSEPGRSAGPDPAAPKRDQMMELPEMTRLLVVAAYIVSYNKPTLDRQIFDVKTRTGRVRGRTATMDSDRQVEAAKEARLKGPHSFPLQRLLTCLSYLQSGRDVIEVDSGGREVGAAAARGPRPGGPDDGSGSGGQDENLAPADVNLDACLRDGGAGSRPAPWCQRAGGGPARPPGWWTCESADLQVQLTTLAAMQLISKAEAELADPLDGAKYICQLSEEDASNLAHSLGMRIADYIKYV